MSPPPPSANDRAAWPFFNAYAILCLAALGVICLQEVQRGHRFVAPLVLVVGLVGVLTRMPGAPMLVLLAFAAGHFVEQHQRQFGFFGGDGFEARSQTFRPADVVLCAAVLAYVAAHYRLQAVASHVFPLDPRLREDTPKKPRRVIHCKRSPRLVTTDEVGWLALTLPVPALLGQLAWLALTRPWDIAGLPPRIARLVIVVWVLGVGAFVIVALVRHWRSRQMTAEEGALFLQDTLWRETRRDQRRINRWLAWSQLRKRKDQS